MKKYIITKEQKDYIFWLQDYCLDYWEILDYFKSIKPKDYNRIFKKISKSYGVKNDKDWEEASYDGTTDDIVLDVKNTILENIRGI